MSRRVWNGKYEVTRKTENFATVDCWYICPYCGEETGSILTVYPEAFDLLENGGFYEPLSCTHCNEKADVMFGKQ